jgi:hypothetical protein
MITNHIHNPGAAFGMTKDPAYDIGMALSPAQFVLLNLPAIQDIAHEVQGIAGMMFEEIVELLGFAISNTKMHIRNEYTAVMLRHHNIYITQITQNLLL